MIRYRGTSPIPDTQFSFGGEEDGGVDDNCAFNFFILQLRRAISSFKSSTSNSSFKILSHKCPLLFCQKQEGIDQLLDRLALLGRLDFLNFTCISRVEVEEHPPPPNLNHPSSSSENPPHHLEFDHKEIGPHRSLGQQ